MKIKRIIPLLFITFNIYSQNFENSILGIQLRQNRETPKNMYKEIIQNGKYEDGYEYEVFPVLKDSSVYAVFEYSPENLKKIWSIQITGSKDNFDFNFKGLKLGFNEKEIIDNLGKPNLIENIGEYGNRWTYSNYSLEISPSGKLSGVKIIDESEKYFKSDYGKIPDFKTYSEILFTNNREKISSILAPNIEIYKGQNTYFFNYSFQKEKDEDTSRVYKEIEEFCEILKHTNPNNTDEYNVNMRITESEGILHVIKIKNNNKYYEIVFKYLFGEYKIWEIKTN